MKDNQLGLTRLFGAHYYVRDLERSRRFYTRSMDFAEIGKSSADLERAGRQRSLVFKAGECVIVCSEPVGTGGRADRYLSHHPDGVGTLAFEVQNIEHTFEELERRGGNPISDLQVYRQGAGWLKTFSITTPFGDTTFRFIERQGYPGLYPGMEPYAEPQGGQNIFGFLGFDHVTSNFQTMSPALLWLEHVMGFERFWDIEFHTRAAAANPGGAEAERAEGAKSERIEGAKSERTEGAKSERAEGAKSKSARGAVARAAQAAHEEAHGSGLRSRVMWHPASGIKFANNEPYRPAFKSSQINIFHEDNRGDGVQHIALATSDILTAVRGLRARGVQFMPTPDAYYELLPGRLEQAGIGQIEERIEDLRELGILIDGEARGSYLLQIFLKDSAGLYESPEAGPFFFELIQRKGDQGFGAGNFRALFESIEREQEKYETDARGPAAAGAEAANEREGHA